MFWNRGLPRIKKGSLDLLEFRLVQVCAENLPKEYGNRILQQIQYLPNIRRINYKHSVVLELYPPSVDSVPNNLLFERTQEFNICKIKFNLDNKNYITNILMVMGSIFEIKTQPIPPESHEKNISTLTIKEVWIEKNVKLNINY